MRLTFICQAVDENDPVHATAVSWIDEFARRPEVEHIRVISLRAGTYALPDNVTVRTIRGRNRLSSLAQFYNEILRSLADKVDCFFIYQGGPYPALLLPFKLITGKPVYQWKAHPYVSPLMWFYARFCDTKVFTSTGTAFPLRLSKVKIVGQGVDTEKFCLKPGQKRAGMVMVGRIAPVKRLEVTLRALAECQRRYGKSCRLSIYGPTLEKDRRYRDYLESLMGELELSSVVSLKGPVPQAELPDILSRHRVFLHIVGSRCALDRAVVEAMSCGVPVLSSNPCVEEILPAELRSLLVVSEDDTGEQAERIHEILSLGDERLAEIGQALRQVVVRDHNVETLVERFMGEMGGSK